jgi:hypothetical protein
MSSSVGGFTAPSMITHFCLRTPDRVLNSSDGREFTSLALFSPLLSLLVFIATFVAGQPEMKPDASKYDIIPDNENTPLTPPLRSRSDGDQPSNLVTGNNTAKRRKSLTEALFSTPMGVIDLKGDIYE